MFDSGRTKFLPGMIQRQLVAPLGWKPQSPLGLTSLGLTGSISHPSDARVEPNPHELGNGGNPGGNRFPSIM